MTRGMLVLCLGALLAAPALAGPEAQPTGLVVFPPQVELSDQRDHQALVVQAQFADGTTRDVTGDAQISLPADAAAVLQGAVLSPASDGQTAITVRFGALRVEVPVSVRGAAQRRALSFRNDCLPVLTRAGCNTGSCHGSSRGKDGFRLSLFGYDPAGDQFRITREQSGRRINRQVPAESLLLEKAIGAVRHTGGKRLRRDGPEYGILLEWLAAGAPADSKDLPRLMEIELYPLRAVLQAKGSQRLLVRARYADGSDRDVTGLVSYTTTDPAVISAEAEGVVRALARGEAHVIARFGEFTVATQVLVVPDDPEFTFPAEDESNPIDALVNAKLRALRVAPSPLADDASFLRRVTLDVIGRLPTLAEREAFLADTGEDRRARWVDSLLAREEFAQLWVMLWAERLLIRSSQRVSEKAVYRYAGWLEEKLRANTPIDRVVVELLTSTGGVFEVPATNFYQAEPDDKKLAESVAQVFLGMRMQCAQCHNHPFDRWTQSDYYGWAAFFSQVGRKRGGDPRETIVFDKRNGEIKHPVTQQPVKPRFLGGAEPETKGKDRRRVAAEWIVSKDNPWFARNLANMVWTQLFGVGIVHEPDDMRVSNPPSNPALLDALAVRFADSGYDFRALVRLICTSRAYQRSTQVTASNGADTRNYARAQVRRLRAEVLLDAIAQVTDAPGKFKGLPRGARAVQIADGAYGDYFLTTFGRAERTSVCSCEVELEPNLSQALHLLNGKTVTGKIREGKLIERRLKAKVVPVEIARELYLRCFGREPTEREREFISARLQAGGPPAQTLEDLFWALLNSREFLFQH